MQTHGEAVQGDDEQVARVAFASETYGTFYETDQYEECAGVGDTQVLVADIRDLDFQVLADLMDDKWPEAIAVIV